MLLFVSIGMNVHFPKLRFIDDKSEIPICLQVNVFMCLYDDNDKNGLQYQSVGFHKK